MKKLTDEQRAEFMFLSEQIITCLNQACSFMKAAETIMQEAGMSEDGLANSVGVAFNTTDDAITAWGDTRDSFLGEEM